MVSDFLKECLVSEQIKQNVVLIWMLYNSDAFKKEREPEASAEKFVHTNFQKFYQFTEQLKGKFGYVKVVGLQQFI